MNTPSLSYGQARLAVLNLCEDFRANHGDDNTEDHATAVRELEHQVNYFLGRGKVSGSLLNEVLEDLRQLSLVETGDHEDLIYTRYGTIDEGGATRNHYEAELDTDLRLLVTDAGFEYGTVAA